MITRAICLSLLFAGAASAALTNTNFVASGSAVMADTNGATFSPAATVLVVNARAVVFPDGTTQTTANASAADVAALGALGTNAYTLASNAWQAATGLDTTSVFRLAPGTTPFIMWSLDAAYFDETAEVYRIALTDMAWTNGTSGNSIPGDGVGDEILVSTVGSGLAQTRALLITNTWTVSGVAATNLLIPPGAYAIYINNSSNIITQPLTGWDGAYSFGGLPPALVAQYLARAYVFANLYTGDVSSATLASYMSISDWQTTYQSNLWLKTEAVWKTNSWTYLGPTTNLLTNTIIYLGVHP